MAYKGSLMDYLNNQVALAKLDNITKQQFGKYMHDDTKTREQKLEFLEKVEQAGGYEALAEN